MKKLTYTLIMIPFLILGCGSDEEQMKSGEGVFLTTAGNANIEGELFLPDGEGPFTVLIIVPGSGNETRESLKPFVPVLNAEGYGVYTYDKRGLGGSTGSYPVETIENPLDFLNARADDVISIIDLLKTHTDVKSDGIGLFSSSQGTWVSTLVYDQNPSDIGLMLMSSGGATATRVEHYYEELIAKGHSIADANQKLLEYADDMGYNPLPTLRKTNIPTLFIFGGKDDSHPTQYDKQLVEQLQKPNFTIHYYENADHSLIDSETNALPGDLFNRLGDWLQDQN